MTTTRMAQINRKTLILKLLVEHPEITQQSVADLVGVTRECVQMISSKAGLSRRKVDNRHTD